MRGLMPPSGPVHHRHERTQNEEHSKAPMTTHASGSDENKLSAAEEVWAKLLEGNQRFVDGNLLARDVVARRRAVLAGQQPQVVVLGCSDSRVISLGRF